MKSDLQIPRIMIAAPGSGSGKTLITCAILQILKRKRLRAAAFKCGPDYIDPMFHKSVLGVPSRNLDLFLAGEEGVIEALRKGSAGQNIAVLEGVMGLFDGMCFTSDENSSYDIARKTRTPVILVVNCAGMGRSVIPLIKGFSEYGRSEERSLIKGVILNNASKAVFDSLKDEIVGETGTHVLGFLPKLKGVELNSRHLGLFLPNEIPDLAERIDKAADVLMESLDVDRLLEIAGYGGTERQVEVRIEATPAGGMALQGKRDDAIDKEERAITANHIKIGIAMDEAFCFYYEDNLDLLKEKRADLVCFSPIHDKEIPDVSGIILGGGYPELYAKELSENESMRRSLKAAADNGMPILAECGGFLYLNKTLKTPNEQACEMAGVFEADSFLTGKLSHFGYVNVEACQDTCFLRRGEIVRGHEFHYYDTTENGCLCDIKKPAGNRSWKGYMEKDNVFAGFAHLYYPSAPEFINRFLKRAHEYHQ